MKTFLLLLFSIFYFLFSVSSAHAAGWSIDLTNIINQFSIKGCQPDKLAACGLSIVDFLINLGAILLVILILWAAVEMIVNGALGKGIDDQKKRLQNGIVGFILLLLSKGLFALIGYFLGTK